MCETRNHKKEMGKEALERHVLLKIIHNSGPTQHHPSSSNGIRHCSSDNPLPRRASRVSLSTSTNNCMRNILRTLAENKTRIPTTKTTSVGRNVRLLNLQEMNTAHNLGLQMHNCKEEKKKPTSGHRKGLQEPSSKPRSLNCKHRGGDVKSATKQCSIPKIGADYKDNHNQILVCQVTMPRTPLL